MVATTDEPSRTTTRSSGVGKPPCRSQPHSAAFCPTPMGTLVIWHAEVPSATSSNETSLGVMNHQNAVSVCSMFAAPAPAAAPCGPVGPVSPSAVAHDAGSLSKATHTDRSDTVSRNLPRPVSSTSSARPCSSHGPIQSQRSTSSSSLVGSIVGDSDAWIESMVEEESDAFEERACVGFTFGWATLGTGAGAALRVVINVPIPTKEAAARSPAARKATQRFGASCRGCSSVIADSSPDAVLGLSRVSIMFFLRCG